VDTEEVADLAAAGAQLVEVLPKPAFDAEHLPGACNLPMDELEERATDALDRATPTVVYCYDHECDLSARGAAILEALGFDDVYDYVASKVAWMATGRPVEGTTAASSRAGALARPVPTCRLDEPLAAVVDRFDDTGIVVAVDHDRTILGVLRAEVRHLPADTPLHDVVRFDPPSVRPSITAADLAKSMKKDGRSYVLVSFLDGVLIGVIRAGDLHGQH
jgi:rhodanese-related sulfurtransferase